MSESDKPITVVAVDDDPDILEAVRILLDGDRGLSLIDVGKTGREALKLANSLAPDVMILDVNMPGINGLEAAERISSTFPAIGLLMLTSQDSPEHIKMAMRAGVREYLNKTTDFQQLPDAIRRASKRSATTVSSRALACVWSFYGTKGSAGTTTLALNTACDLASLGYRVLLMDLDLLHGDIAFYLGLTPPEKVKRLLGCLDELTAIEAEQVRAATLQFQIPVGDKATLDILDSPSTLVPSDARADENLAALFEFLLTAYDYIIVDLPPGRIFDASMAIVLDCSERLLVVGNRDYSSFRALLAFARILGKTSFSMNRVSLLFNGLLTPADFDYRTWLAQQQLGEYEVLEIPVDHPGCAEALKNAVPIVCVKPSSSLSRFVGQLVEQSLNRPASRGRSGTLWQSFKGIFTGEHRG